MGAVLNYFDELTKAMTMLAQDERTIFVGQNMRYDGQRMHASFASVPMERRIEFPVAEDFQMGFCTGLALEGFIPVCVYPRIDFLLLAANQLVNHLDKFTEMCGYGPKVIIRTAVGSSYPLNPGPQHCQDHVRAFSELLTNVRILPIEQPSQAVEQYRRAMLEHLGPALVVEYMERY
jgi:pyruvate/2-oxoglutarate/acetoin dehydrogenase E1 component